MSLIDQILQRGTGLVRGTVARAGRVGGRVLSDASGQVQRVRNARTTPKELDDATLAHKVESIVFRDGGAPKSTVKVNVAAGRVQLRGTLKNAAAIEALVARVHAIPEVGEVDNLLHTRKTPSPTRADTPRGQQKPKAATQKKRAATRKTSAKVSDDKTSRLADQAEPTGAELAAQGKGRQPAPLGNEGAEAPGEGAEAPGEGAPGSGSGGSGTPGERVERALEHGAEGDQSSSAAARIAAGESAPAT